MAKIPPNIPSRMDRVHKRGADPSRLGVLVKMDDETQWATVNWDDQGGPRICHLYELERKQEA